MSFICGLYELLIFATLISNLIVLSALNPIHRMVWLIVVFILGSFLFLFLDFFFIGLTYIVVYVGAIAILFLFVIMMVQIQHTPNLNSFELNSSPDTRPWVQSYLSSVFFISLVLILFVLSLKGSQLFTYSFVVYYYTSWFESYTSFTDIETLGNMIYIAYPSALVFLGVLLWSVLIGVIKITMAQQK